MKKLMAVFLALCMILALSACSTPDPTEPPTEPPTDPPACEVPDPTEPTPTLPQVTVENPIAYFSMSYSIDGEPAFHASAYDNDEGQAHVEYNGQVRKIGTFDLSVLHGITAEMDKTALKELNGKDVYEEGTAEGSMYILLSDETMISASFSGKIPQEFLDACDVMDAYFQLLTASLDVYVPQPVVMDGTDETIAGEILQIMNSTGIENLDSIYISDVPMDEFFGITVGLTQTEGVIKGVQSAPIMMATAFSFNVIQVSADADVAAIYKDFADHLEWNKWVCVSATHAMIAQKGDLILCLMGSSDLYTKTAAAIESNGWTNIEIYENPDL